jgi:vitamin B12/bleomycin/antimicrobial peptide transport system ATP-binding/permease protein
MPARNAHGVRHSDGSAGGATASLDEPSEAKLYRLLLERLPRATIVSIGHRSTLFAFHERHLTLLFEGDSHRIREGALGRQGAAG